MSSRKVPLRSSSIALVGWEVHADHPDESVQGPPVPGRSDPAGGAVVSAVSTRVSACVGDSDGTRPLHRRELHLAVGTGVCARVGQALPSASEEHQQELPRGRDLYKEQGQRAVPLSCRGLYRPDNRFSVDGKARCRRREALLSKGYSVSRQSVTASGERRQEPGISSGGGSHEG